MSAKGQGGQGRGLLLTRVLGSIVVMGVMLFLVLLVGGFFFGILLVIASIVSVGMIHYYVWGQALQEETAGEREEAQLLDRVKAELPRETRVYPRE